MSPQTLKPEAWTIRASLTSPGKWLFEGFKRCDYEFTSPWQRQKYMIYSWGYLFHILYSLWTSSRLFFHNMRGCFKDVLLFFVKIAWMKKLSICWINYSLSIISDLMWGFFSMFSMFEPIWSFLFFYPYFTSPRAHWLSSFQRHINLWVINQS